MLCTIALALKKSICKTLFAFLSNFQGLWCTVSILKFIWMVFVQQPESAHRCDLIQFSKHTPIQLNFPKSIEIPTFSLSSSWELKCRFQVILRKKYLPLKVYQNTFFLSLSQHNKVFAIATCFSVQDVWKIQSMLVNNCCLASLIQWPQVIVEMGMIWNAFFSKQSSGGNSITVAFFSYITNDSRCSILSHF